MNAKETLALDVLEGFQHALQVAEDIAVETGGLVGIAPEVRKRYGRAKRLMSYMLDAAMSGDEERQRAVLADLKAL